MSNLFDLTGKTAVAIGGNSVLGGSISKGLAAQGAQVAIVGRNMETAEEIAKEIEANGGTAKSFQGDVSSRDSIENLATEIEQWSGGWDILLNASRKNSTTSIVELDEEEWDYIMEVKLKGIVFTKQIVAKRMVEQERSISFINISSVSSTTLLSIVFTYS